MAQKNSNSLTLLWTFIFIVIFSLAVTPATARHRTHCPCLNAGYIIGMSYNYENMICRDKSDGTPYVAMFGSDKPGEDFSHAAYWAHQNNPSSGGYCLRYSSGFPRAIDLEAICISKEEYKECELQIQKAIDHLECSDGDPGDPPIGSFGIEWPPQCPE
jgi:hypothetical protein